MPTQPKGCSVRKRYGRRVIPTRKRTSKEARAAMYARWTEEEPERPENVHRRKPGLQCTQDGRKKSQSDPKTYIEGSQDCNVHNMYGRRVIPTRKRTSNPARTATYSNVRKKAGRKQEPSPTLTTTARATKNACRTAANDSHPADTGTHALDRIFEDRTQSRLHPLTPPGSSQSSRRGPEGLRCRAT